MKEHFEHTESNMQGKISLIQEGKLMATVTYVRKDAGNVRVDHTIVEPEARGTGAGKRIIAELVRWARKNNQRITAECTFAKAVIVKNPDMQDILNT